MPNKELGPEQLNKLLELQEQIKEEIAKAIRNNDAEARVGDITISITKLLETDDGDVSENTKGYYKASSKNNSISAKTVATKNRQDKDYKKAKIDTDVDFDVKTIRTIADQKQRKEHEDEIKIKKHEVDGKDSMLLQKEIEQGLRSGNVVEMEIDREFSSSENMNMFLKRAFGVSANKCYRVQGKDNHDFKYVVKTSSGKYEQIDLSTQPEGKNSWQKIWIMDDGELKEKRVDSLLIRGQYAIATDFPDSVVSQNTTTYVVTRLPNGQYLGSEIGQKYGVNRNTSGNVIQKDNMARAKSKYQLEDIVDAANLAQKSDVLNRDGKLTTEEVELVRKLKKDKGLTDQEVFDTIDTIAILKELGFDCGEIKNMMVQAKDAEKIEKIKESAENVERDGGQKEHIMGPYINPRRDY